MEHGIIKIYYGEGHGKSTAAIGNAIQMAGTGGESVVVQFLKSKNECEEAFYRRLEPEIKFFRFAKSQERFDELSDEQKQEEMLNLRNGFNYGKKVISTGACDLVILDEVLGLADLGVITIEELKQVLAAKPDDMEVICTGRVLADGIRELADQIYHIAAEKA